MVVMMVMGVMMVVVRINYRINPFIINWITSFLKNRFPQVKLATNCQLEWKTVSAGVLQGTKLGPWLFIVMIDDLQIPSASGVLKYVDDTAIYEIVNKNLASNAQTSVN